mmetsp:Transcript_55612/g.120066  ORF Transcript_55612/g.120066 Transcript_55612/m.120066 type:complete len:246 (-) Transcript_55612:207-944(-)
MGVSLGRIEATQGVEALLSFDVRHVREIFVHFEEVCPTPVLWERSFDELLGCFESSEACSKAFAALDTNVDGFIDARELLGSLAMLSKGHLKDRMLLLFDIFDMNQENDMVFAEAFLMLRRTTSGLRKITGIPSISEKVLYAMTKQVWRVAKKHRDVRITSEDWFSWWSNDATIRSALKMFLWKPEDQRGLPPLEGLSLQDYTRTAEESMGKGERASSRGVQPKPPPESTRPTGNPRRLQVPGPA